MSFQFDASAAEFHPSPREQRQGRRGQQQPRRGGGRFARGRRALNVPDFVYVHEHSNEDTLRFFGAFVDEVAQLVSEGKNVGIALDCEGHHLGLIDDSLDLIQVGLVYRDANPLLQQADESARVSYRYCDSEPVFLVDVQAPGDALKRLLSMEKLLVFGWDLRCDLAALRRANLPVMGQVIDLQLFTLAEADPVFGLNVMGLAPFVRHHVGNRAAPLTQTKHSHNDERRVAAFRADSEQRWIERPFEQDFLQYSANDVALVRVCVRILFQNPKAREHTFKSVCEMSRQRQEAFGGDDSGRNAAKLALLYSSRGLLGRALEQSPAQILHYTQPESRVGVACRLRERLLQVRAAATWLQQCGDDSEQAWTVELVDTRLQELRSWSAQFLASSLSPQDQV